MSAGAGSRAPIQRGATTGTTLRRNARAADPPRAARESQIHSTTCSRSGGRSIADMAGEGVGPRRQFASPFGTTLEMPRTRAQWNALLGAVGGADDLDRHAVRRANCLHRVCTGGRLRREHGGGPLVNGASPSLSRSRRHHLDRGAALRKSEDSRTRRGRWGGENGRRRFGRSFVNCDRQRPKLCRNTLLHHRTVVAQSVGCRILFYNGLLH